MKSDSMDRDRFLACIIHDNWTIPPVLPIHKHELLHAGKSSVSKISAAVWVEVEKF